MIGERSDVSANSVNKIIKQALDGKLLAKEGPRLAKDTWASAVYLGTDGFVYHLEASRERDEINFQVRRKNSIGEYLRWVDDVFNDQTTHLPSAQNTIHYQAAWNLRDIL